MGIEPPKQPKNCNSVLAIDFETANFEPQSACALGAVLLDGPEIVARESSLIRPYTGDDFHFSYLHGIEWKHVEAQPSFDEVWPRFARLWERADIVVAHNASFDMRVLFACARFGKFVPAPRWYGCTVALSRKCWPQWPNHRLDTACRKLGIALNHHEAAADAEACAQLFVAGMNISRSIQTQTHKDWTTETLPAGSGFMAFHVVRNGKRNDGRVAPPTPVAAS